MCITCKTKFKAITCRVEHVSTKLVWLNTSTFKSLVEIVENILILSFVPLDWLIFETAIADKPDKVTVW